MAQIVQNLLDHIHPQTGGFPPETAVLPGEKQVENAGKVLRRNTAARILYAQHNVRRRVICLTKLTVKDLADSANVSEYICYSLFQKCLHADLGRGIGSEQEGCRPVVIIQNDVGNTYSPTTIIAPISRRSHAKANLPTHYHIEPTVGLAQPSTILLEQIRVIDKQRLGHRLGMLPKADIRGMEKALLVSVGIASVGKKITLCLCRTCAQRFYGSGAFTMRRRNPMEVEMDICSYCNRRRGFDYELAEKEKR